MSLPAIAPGNAPVEGARTPPADQRLPAPWGCQRPRAASVSAARRRKLAELAEKVRQLQTTWRPAWQRCPTGLAKLDAALGGGFARGCIHELLAPAGEAATRSLALLAAARAVEASFPSPAGETPAATLPTDRLAPAATLSTNQFEPAFTRQSPPPALRAQAATGWVFYIDTDGDFYPPAAAQFGMPLQRLLIIRPRRTADALWVCEQALCCPALAAVVLPIRTLDAHVSRRLQLAAEAGGGLGFLLRRESHGGQTFATTRLRLDPLPSNGLRLADRRPTGTSAATQPDPLRDKSPTPCSARDGASTRDTISESDAFAHGIDADRRMRITLLKLRDGRPAAPFELVLPLAVTREPTPRASRASRPSQTRSPYPPASAS